MTPHAGRRITASAKIFTGNQLTASREDVDARLLDSGSRNEPRRNEINQNSYAGDQIHAR
jgi:hypothetical protein